MHKPKPYKCSICGAEVPDQPMPVLKHQLSHLRRPMARDRPLPRGVPLQDDTDHTEFCPFCGETFDARDLGKVLEHYDHQVAAGLPAVELKPDEEVP